MLHVDWLELLFGAFTVAAAAALAYRRGRRRTGPALPERNTATQIPPAERYDHDGTIEDTERQRAENEAASHVPDGSAGDRWRRF